MAIDDFGTWFEKAKAFSGKAKEMEELKSLFQNCWDNVYEALSIEKTKIRLDQLTDALDSLQSKLEEISYDLNSANEYLSDAMSEVDKIKDEEQ